jgi:hypothetical protein
MNFKKMDEKDFVFINKRLSAKEKKEFSEFLKTRKQKTIKRKIRSSRTRKRSISTTGK